MRKSKYLNKTFDNGWVCTHVGVARKQSVFLRKSRVLSSRPHHQTYYYIFERPTSDGKADKMIRLSASMAAQVWKGLVKVEDLLDKRESKNANTFIRKISYHFN
jgi:hypothetical protein